MGVSLKQWQKMFDVTADLLLEHEEELSKIDAVIGDGDHGLTIAKIARLMKDKATKEYDSAEAYFDDLGWDAINVQGGSAGPLFGTWLSGMKNAPEGAGVAEVLENALEELRTISQAKVGEKTMMDAIIPATEAANAAADDASALEAAEKAAKEGAEQIPHPVFGHRADAFVFGLGRRDCGRGHRAGFQQPPALDGHQRFGQPVHHQPSVSLGHSARDQNPQYRDPFARE